MTTLRAVISDVADPAGRARLGFGLYAAHLAMVVGLSVSNVLLALSTLTAPWTVGRRAVAWAQVRPALAALGAYVIFLLVSIATSYEPLLSLRAASEVFNLATLVLALLLVRGERQVRRLVDVIVAVAAVAALAGLAQYLVGFGELGNRIRGPFSHYMTFSGVLLVADLLLAAHLVCRHFRVAPWRWAALVVINLALVGSLTRSAWVALGLAVAALLLLRRPRWFALFVPAAALAVALAPAPVRARALSVFDLADRSNYDRLCMAEAGLYMIGERPLFGIGPDLVKHRYPIYRHPTAPRLEVPHLHNTFVQLAAERGLLSLAAYLALMGLALVRAWHGYQRERVGGDGLSDLHLGAFFALLAFNLAGLFEYNWGDTEVQRWVLFVVAIPFCLDARDSHDSHHSKDSRDSNAD